MKKAILTSVARPDFSAAAHLPELEPAIFRGRLARLEARVRQAGLDALVVYADREHAANMAWLTGFSPRFEEALAVLVPGRPLMLFAGPENAGLARVSALDPAVVLYPPFGLMGQDRSATPPLADLLAGSGLDRGMGIGAAGWKYFGPPETATPRTWLELPSYIVDTLRETVGARGSVANAGALFMDAGDGLRATLEIEELARFEFSACHASAAVMRVVTGTCPGMCEFEAAALLAPIGLPLNCHAMFSSGPRAWFGLPSPTSRTVQLGDAVTTAYGVEGALSCRNGWLAAGPEDLPEGVRDYVSRLVAPYFEAVAEWLMGLRVGARAGDLHAAIMKRLGDPFFGVTLNPGHLIHLDEWMNSPFFPGSDVRLASGMAIQVDIIPATGGPYFTSNMEDGLALLDAGGRARFAECWPDAFRRIGERRRYMKEELGIALHEDVLPFSNLASWLPPFWLDADRAMALR